jgi:hypothetical protein
MDELTRSHELTAFRDFRSDAPGPSAAETAAARVRLLDAMAAHPAASRLTSWLRGRTRLGRMVRTRFWVPIAAAAAVTAVVVTMVLLAVPGHTQAPTPKPSQVSSRHRSAHPRHQASHPAHGTAGPGTSHGPAGRAGGKTAGTGAAGSSAPGSAGGPGSAASSASTPTSTILSVSSPVIGEGQTETLTATVATTRTGLPVGSVSFYWDAGSLGVYSGAYSGALERLCTVQVSYNAQNGYTTATCSFTLQGAQTGLVSAEYSGSEQYQESSSSSVAVAFTAPTVTTLAVSSAAVNPGQTATFTATVTDQAGDNLSGYTVSFSLAAAPSPGMTAPASSLNVCYDVPLTYDASTHENVATCSYTPTGGYNSPGPSPYVVEAGASYDASVQSESSLVTFTVDG